MVASLLAFGAILIGSGVLLSARAAPTTSPAVVGVGGPVAGSLAPSPTLGPVPPTPTVPPPPAPTPGSGVAVVPPPASAPTAVPARPTPSQAPTALTPTRTVLAFYVAVARHDWPAAIGLWSPSMQQRYPPQQWLIGRFADTTRIWISRLQTTALDTAAGTATVAVTLTEYRSVPPSPRTFVGSWDLVRLDGRWYLDQPHF